MPPAKHSLGYSQWTADEQRVSQFFWTLEMAFFASFSFRLLADTSQSLLLRFHLPATCRGHSAACLISGRCRGLGSSHPHRTARKSWDSLAAFASPQFSTPSERNTLVSSSGVNMKTEHSPFASRTLKFRSSIGKVIPLSRSWMPAQLKCLLAKPNLPSDCHNTCTTTGLLADFLADSSRRSSLHVPLSSTAPLSTSSIFHGSSIFPLFHGRPQGWERELCSAQVWLIWT